MTYWHMQLFPTGEQTYINERDILEKTLLIGLGEWDEKKGQRQSFKHEMQIGDIVLIRKGVNPIALVEIVGELEDNGKDKDDSLDWFRYRKKIKVLEYAEDGKYDFPVAQGTLTKAVDKKTPTYRYIENWHKKVSPSFFKDQDGLKIRKIYIQKYQIFEEFNFNTTTNNEPLDVVVIAGINGSGKTTLLEYINNFADYIPNEDKDKSFIEFEMYDEKNHIKTTQKLNYSNSTEVLSMGGIQTKQESLVKNYLKNNVIYFSTDTDMEGIKESIPKYLENLVWREYVKADLAMERLKAYINNIFTDIGLLVEFDSMNENKELFFHNKQGEQFTIDKLSTGEKTLVSKVLYLYLQGIKNKVILIDEPELSLHPSWQNKILKLYEKFANEYNCQIIIATHSPHIIGSAKPECIRVLDNNKVLDNFDKSYGLEFDKILTQIMGLNETRTPEIAKKILQLWKYLEDENHTSAEYQTLYDELEKTLGSLDKDLILARLEVAKLKIKNA